MRPDSISRIHAGLALGIALVTSCGDDGSNPFDMATGDSSGNASTGMPAADTGPAADTSTSDDPDDS